MIQFQLPRVLRHVALAMGRAALIGGIGLAAIEAEAGYSLYRSTDGAASWSKVGQGLPPEARINALNVSGAVTMAGTDQGVFLSRDAGATWMAALPGVGTESRVLCFTSQAGRVFAGTHNHGVLLSADQGLTWTTVNDGLTDTCVRSLLSVGPKLYAGTDRKGVFVSADGGVSWTDQRTGLPELSQVFDLVVAGGTVFAGLYSKGLYRWETMPARWVKAGEVAPLELVTCGETLVAGHNPGGVFFSNDRGTTWQDGNSGLPDNAPVWTLAADGDRVLVGTSGSIGFNPENIGLFVSRDRGKSWTRGDAGLPPSAAAISFLATQQFILAAIITEKN